MSRERNICKESALPDCSTAVSTHVFREPKADDQPLGAAPGAAIVLIVINALQDILR
jgi:hypothetical protein